MEQQSSKSGPRGLDITRRETISRVAGEIIQIYGEASTQDIRDAVNRKSDKRKYNTYEVHLVLGHIPHKFRVIGYKGSVAIWSRTDIYQDKPQ